MCQSLADTGIVEDGSGCGGGALAVVDSLVASVGLNKLAIGDNMENIDWRQKLIEEVIYNPSTK